MSVVATSMGGVTGERRGKCILSYREHVSSLRYRPMIEQEIVALRDELSVLKRLARAQDRKFEGCQAHALARRLWLAEEELRIARSTISSLGAEVSRCCVPKVLMSIAPRDLRVRRGPSRRNFFVDTEDGSEN